ncbi:PhzF family phenazine biosynthesis protein [Nostocoides sp. HKS02]|uniref:PhzF family phenazine biosynthesis protein n=1 Tax=Nostocoides sp. HKS02 TaxID=1813880 RepID=UPI0012B46239|nr:PhzF family phenazine biosynthesis protein [Tetrasphaera sp. HKS02]QGN57326.1 PhzF family phenazine biosynthesis isomerase [Tetrasphaera sp. HKS02]
MTSSPLRYRLLNVFAQPDDPFSGNPLCVFEDGSGLSEHHLQALARQFNLSETTFLVEPQGGADVGVRIFTPHYEMAFAGHPTLGSAAVARELARGGDLVRLSMPAGVIPVTADGPDWTLTARPGVVGPAYDVADIAAAVGLRADELVGPVHEVSTGSAQVIAQAASVEAIHRAVGDAALMRRYAGMGTRGGETLVYLWCETGDGTIEARALFTQGSAAIEDPATGSACSNLGAWLASVGRSGEWSVAQGSQVDRPSTLRLAVSDDGVVTVGGLVRQVGWGEVEL